MSRQREITTRFSKTIEVDAIFFQCSLPPRTPRLGAMAANDGGDGDRGSSSWWWRRPQKTEIEKMKASSSTSDAAGESTGLKPFKGTSCGTLFDEMWLCYCTYPCPWPAIHLRQLFCGAKRTEQRVACARPPGVSCSNENSLACFVVFFS